MSASEDYLDQLLNGMAGNEKKEQDSVSDSDFLQDLEGDLAGDFGADGSDDAFLKNFEKDLNVSDDDFLFSDSNSVAGEGEPISFQNLDELISLSREEADETIENMKPTSSRASNENFDLGLSDPVQEYDPANVPEDILNLLENVEEASEKNDGEEDSGEEPSKEAREETLPEEESAAAEDIAAAEEPEISIGGEEMPGSEETSGDVEEPLPEGDGGETVSSDEAETPEIAPDPDAVAERAAAESGIQDESNLEAGGEESAEDLLSLLNGLEGDGSELSDIGDLLNQDAAGVQELTQEEIENLQGELQEGASNGSGEQTEESGESKKGRLSKSKKKKGKDQKEGGSEKKGKGAPSFLKRLLSLFFDEPDDVDDASIAAAAADGGLSGISDDNLAILKELDAVGEGDNGTVPADGKKKKKKEKKPKKEKPPKEPKPKKEKKPKPKKEKKPKEVDNSPKLPKKPVIVIALFAASLLALIVVAVKSFGKAGSVPDAKAAYEEGDYIACFRELSGMKLSETDAELFEKSRILSSIQQPYQDYQVLLGIQEYDMALDSLIRSVGRCYNYEEEANALQLQDAVLALRDQSVAELQNVYGISLEDALSLYGLRSRDEYTDAVQEINRQLGYQKEKG